MAAEKIRDAERSREAILDAAELLFADRGFDAASLGEVGAAAALSRGTPSYFFGSKEQLYVAVLERVFEDREEATRQAFRPLSSWCEGEGGGSLERAMTQAVGGYIEFLLRRPSFAKLLQREELAGGHRLRNTPRESKAIERAFQDLRRIARKRGLSAFEVSDAVLLFVSLTYSPLTQRSTFLMSLDRDLDDPGVRRRHVKLVSGQILHLVGG